MGFRRPGVLTRRGHRLSRDALQQCVAPTHARAAAQSCPTLVGKKISPHVLRHSTATRLLHAGVDTTVIAHWLSHESVATTQIYIHADLALKERALARTTDRSHPRPLPANRHDHRVPQQPVIRPNHDPVSAGPTRSLRPLPPLDMP